MNENESLLKEIKFKKFTIIALETKLNSGTWIKYREKHVKDSPETDTKKDIEISDLKKKLAGTEEEKIRFASKLEGLKKTVTELEE